MTSAHITAATRYFTEVLSQGNLDVLDEICVPDLYFSSPSDVFQTRSELRRAVEVYRIGFPDLHAKVTDTFVGHDTVVLVGDMSGTQTGMLIAEPPTGRRAQLRFAIEFRFSDAGLIDRMEMISDRSTVEQQLGVPSQPLPPE